MSDNLPLGKINPGQIRDAFHVAVITVILGEDYMRPGQKVKMKFGTNDTIISADYSNCGDYIGIIDPFINGYLYKGDRVLLCLKPGTVTGMEHRWKHPLFDEQPKEVKGPELWLREFAERWGFNYDEMIETASNPEYDNYITACGKDLHSVEDLGGDYYIFWEKMEELNRKQYNEEHRKKVGWSCSC